MESLLKTATEGGKELSFLGVDVASLELEPWPLPTIETEGMEVDVWDEWIVEETYRKFLFAVADVELPC
jgi:hypothetical protein